MLEMGALVRIKPQAIENSSLNRAWVSEHGYLWIITMWNEERHRYNSKSLATGAVKDRGGTTLWFAPHELEKANGYPKCKRFVPGELVSVNAKGKALSSNHNLLDKHGYLWIIIADEDTRYGEASDARWNMRRIPMKSVATGHIEDWAYADEVDRVEEADD